MHLVFVFVTYVTVVAVCAQQKKANANTTACLHPFRFFFCPRVYTCIRTFFFFCLGQDIHAVKRDIARGVVTESVGKDKIRSLEEKVWTSSRTSTFAGMTLIFVPLQATYNSRAFPSTTTPQHAFQVGVGCALGLGLPVRVPGRSGGRRERKPELVTSSGVNPPCSLSTQPYVVETSSIYVCGHRTRIVPSRADLPRLGRRQGEGLWMFAGVFVVVCFCCRTTRKIRRPPGGRISPLILSTTARPTDGCAIDETFRKPPFW